MRRHPELLYTAIVAVCFLYTGSAYMSQFERLTEFYDGTAVDIITSGWNYLFQAAGIGLFCVGLWKWPRVFRQKTVFALLLATGAVFMAISQIAATGIVVVLAGYAFNLHIGVYFGFYLAMFADNVPGRHAGLCCGAAYAAGSVGTYALSLVRGGAFLASPEITLVYIALAAVTAGLVLAARDLADGALPEQTPEKAPEPGLRCAVIAVMMMISVTGSGLYYSLPYAQNINWNLIRAFYAGGLLLAGVIADRSRIVGEICAAASLAYPLIAAALIGEGVSGTAALGASYAFRGFLSVFYILLFTDLGTEDRALLVLAPAGLLTARLTEAVLSLLFLPQEIPPTYQLVFSALLFLPLLILFVRMENRRYAAPSLSPEKRRVLFAEAYGLTARESEVLHCLTEGMSDDEIAEKCFISKSTVRFHISNILKKTQTGSRVEVTRLYEKQ